METTLRGRAGSAGSTDAGSSAGSGGGAAAAGASVRLHPDSGDSLQSLAALLDSGERFVTAYRKGGRSQEVAMGLQGPIQNAARSLDKASMEVDQLATLQRVLQGHTAGAKQARRMCDEIGDGLGTCRHKLLAAWGLVIAGSGGTAPRPAAAATPDACEA